MILGDAGLADLIGAVLGFVFTVLVFSYILGDNVLFRVVIHIFVGVAAGYAAIVAWYEVIWPQLILPVASGTQSERLFVLFPLILSGLLLLKVSPALARFGNPAAAYLVGVGMAAAIGGAVLGTITPQVGATIGLFDPLERDNATWLLQLMRGGVILIGTVATLAYFQYGARQELGYAPKRSAWVEALAIIGQLFIMVTYGVLFAGVYSAALTALIERLQFIRELIFPLFLTG